MVDPLVSYNDLLNELIDRNSQLKNIGQRIKTISKTRKGFANLMNMLGVRIINSSALVSAMGDAKQFSSARGFAAFLVIAPKHEQSGTTLKSKGISKNGNRYLRTLLIHGTRAVVIKYKNMDNPLKILAGSVQKSVSGCVDSATNFN